MSEISSPFKVFSGTNSRYLAEKICKSLGCPLGKMKIEHFSDGEFSVSFEESIRGQYIYLVQSTFPNSDNLMELLLMIDAAKKSIGIQNHCSYSVLRLGSARPKR
jgi:ribose-phosphate pyrophosphokinase